MLNAKQFFDAYAPAFNGSAKVVDVGSQDVNGSLREVCPFEYIGLDFEQAKGVDIVLTDPYSFPLEDESTDIIITSSTFEHSEMFWLVFLEMLRILKPHGLIYINAPSGGDFHRYPVDCWRFYPDSGRALETWARRHSINAAMLESYIQSGGGCYDFVSVFLKDEAAISRYPNRILHTKQDFENGQIRGQDGILNYHATSQDSADRTLLRRIERRLSSHS